MRTLKIILAGLAALIGVLWLVGMFLPGDYRIERSIVIDAPPELVFAQVNDFHNWKEWSPWAAADPTLETTFSGPESGEGHTQRWTSEGSGAGSQTITLSQPPRRIETALDFGPSGSAEADWTFEPTPEGVRTTWGLSGEAEGAIGHYFALFMDDMVGDYYEEGLARLKAHTEKLADERAAEEASAAAEGRDAGVDAAP